MTRNNKILCILITAAVFGWIVAISSVSTIGATKLHTSNLEDEATTWKRQAGKAYTEMLKAKSGSDSAIVLIPKGSRIGCTMTPSKSKCEDEIIYPPRDF